MIIVNERKYIEQILNSEEAVVENVGQVVSILARYYFSEGVAKEELPEKIMEFMQLRYPKYQVQKKYWKDKIEHIVKHVEKTALFESEGVVITVPEWDRIHRIKNKLNKRLAFTVLCVAKLNNQRNPDSNSWVNLKLTELFKIANVGGNNDIRAKKIKALVDDGLIELAKRIDNLNMRVLFIEEGEEVCKIDDFRDLGLTLQMLDGDTTLRRCKKCGKIFKTNLRKTKTLCDDCGTYTAKPPKTIVCVDCGDSFVVPGSSKKRVRCEKCQSERNKLKMRSWRKSHSA